MISYLLISLASSIRHASLKVSSFYSGFRFRFRLVLGGFFFFVLDLRFLGGWRRLAIRTISMFSVYLFQVHNSSLYCMVCVYVWLPCLSFYVTPYSLFRQLHQLGAFSVSIPDPYCMPTDMVKSHATASRLLPSRSPKAVRQGMAELSGSIFHFHIACTMMWAIYSSSIT